MKERMPIISNISDVLLPYFPGLDKKLEIAEMEGNSVEFMDKVVFSSLSSSLSISLIFFIIFLKFQINLWYVPLIFIFLFLFSFYNYSHVPDLRLLKKKRAIEYDIVYAVRQLIIEVNSGVPLFDALVSLTKGYGEFSKAIRRIVEKTTMGEPLSHALKTEAENTPSLAFKRILFQIANETVSGGDLTISLSSLVNQIVKDQIIEIKEYGHKLNPLVMFYLVIGVVFPSLGITFIIILLSFVSNGMVIPFIYMILLAVIIGIFQLMFLGLVETSRPNYAILV